MPPCPPVSRRLLLGRLASGTGIIGTFLLPGRMDAALAAAASGTAAHGRTATRPPAPLVMLDPGHGGKDPGAVGVSGTYEKHVSLAAALELKRQLEAEGRYRVALTRTRDTFIPLDDRVARAQAHGAALFVSMHADALSDHSVRGASVYTLAEFGLRRADRGAGAAREQRRPVRRRGLQYFARDRPHPGQPGTTRDAHRLQPARPQHGRQSRR